MLQLLSLSGCFADHRAQGVCTEMEKERTTGYGSVAGLAVGVKAPEEANAGQPAEVKCYGFNDS